MQDQRPWLPGPTRHAEATGVGRRIDGHRLAADGDVAASPTARDAEDRFENFCAARPQQSADAEDLAPSDIEAHAIEHAPPTAAAHLVEAEIAHRENGRAGAGHGIPTSKRDLSPDHGRNDRVQRKTVD